VSFLQRLRSYQVDQAGRRWAYVPYDQLHDQLGLLADLPPREVGIVLIESPWKARRRPYHRQKLALVLANQRHFALEQAERGVAVEYLIHDGPYHEALAKRPGAGGPLVVMEPAERELRTDLGPLVADGRIEVQPHQGWLTTEADFRESVGATPPWKMDSFYRHVRRRTGYLMEGKQPEGGRFSFDKENRKAWRGTPPAPEPPTFQPDPITREVADLVATTYSDHPGDLDLHTLPASLEDGHRLWAWAQNKCMSWFGPFEDAMSTESGGLFHTRISPLMNLYRLLPRRVVDDVLSLDIPLPSKEGFLRQVLGWREFVRHVHRETDGFRELPPGAEFQGLDATEPLPPAFWGTPSGLHCLDHVVEQVWREGWSHHITRLMVLSNLATLLGYSPRELSDWFWVAYVDAFDWVVEPNVLGMGTFSVGPVMSTKPYVSGSAYLNRMSDYCRSCDLNPKRTCPVTRLYWAFLERNRDTLAGNARIAMPLRSLDRRPAGERALDAQEFRRVRDLLASGARVGPAEGTDPP
jgi:deoxyribodipyrimidine photolyase-related protein